MSKNSKIKTLGELKASGYQPVSVRAEMRRNLMVMIKKKQVIFPGIIGYDVAVIPQIENAILSGQDMILLGERGQAKSRIMRLLINLLDEEIPEIKGCEIHDNPFAPICRQCRDRLAAEKDALEINWLSREERYGEKLATPDISIADLIGDIDPIKVAEGRYLSDELTIHYGLIPRTNRGIFCINELPDLTDRLQVGLFNLMEEKDIQIRGYGVRLPLDILLVASANPEDYTNRGRIITPLKDRYGAQIRTHYPKTIKEEISILELEHRQFQGDGIETYMPQYMKEIVAELTHLARKSAHINQSSGVSVRVSISNYETLISNAVRRAITLGEKMAVPRISDLPYVHSSTSGKIELESFDEVKENKVIDGLIRQAVLNVFNRYYQSDKLREIVAQFKDGFSVEVSEERAARLYLQNTSKVDGLADVLKIVNDSEKPEVVASAIEFILEGLYLNKRLSKVEAESKTVYRN